MRTGISLVLLTLTICFASNISFAIKSGLTGEITYFNVGDSLPITDHFADIKISRWAERYAEFPYVKANGKIADMLIDGKVKEMSFSGCTRKEMDAYFELPEETRGELPRMKVEILYANGKIKYFETYPSWHCYYYDVQMIMFDLFWSDIQKIVFGKLPWAE